jgi:hypothetical protein
MFAKHKSNGNINLRIENKNNIIQETYARTKERIKFRRKKHLCGNRCTFEAMECKYLCGGTIP